MIINFLTFSIEINNRIRFELYSFVNIGAIETWKRTVFFFYQLSVCLLDGVYATFNNISVISWRLVLLVDETGGPEENHRPVASH
jgi:hypothetical protein